MLGEIKMQKLEVFYGTYRGYRILVHEIDGHHTTAIVDDCGVAINVADSCSLSIKIAHHVYDAMNFIDAKLHKFDKSRGLKKASNGLLAELDVAINRFRASNP